MAGHWRYATALVTPVAVTGSAAQVEHPIANVLTVLRPRRTYWTQDAADGKTIDLDFGAAVSLARVLIENTNAGNVKLEGSATLSSFFTALNTTAMPYDPDVQRARGALTPVGFNHRYLRVTLSAVRAPSPGYFYVGAIACIGVQTTAATHYGEPYTDVTVDPRTELAYLGGGGERNLEGERSRRIGPLVGGLPGGAWPVAARGDLNAIRALGVERPLFFDRNDDDPTHAYLLKLTQEVAMLDHGGARGFEAPLHLEEWT